MPTHTQADKKKKLEFSFSLENIQKSQPKNHHIKAYLQKVMEQIKNFWMFIIYGLSGI